MVPRRDTPGSAFLDWIRSGDLAHTRMDSEDMRIKIYGNTGVVTSRGTSSGFYKSQPFSFYEWSTSVFIFAEDKWICVFNHAYPGLNGWR